MSLFKEKLDMYKRGLKNLPNVVQGNLNYYLNEFGALSEDKKAEAERRYAICKVCPFNSLIAPTVISEELGFYDTERTDEHCSACKCPIEKKVMSFDEQCGLSYITNLRDTFGNQIASGWKPLWYEYESK